VGLVLFLFKNHLVAPNCSELKLLRYPFLQEPLHLTGLKPRAKPSQQRGWTRQEHLPSQRKTLSPWHVSYKTSHKLLSSLMPTHSALPREEETHQQHKRRDNPQITPEWAASQ